VLPASLRATIIKRRQTNSGDPDVPAEVPPGLDARAREPPAQRAGNSSCLIVPHFQEEATPWAKVEGRLVNQPPYLIQPTSAPVKRQEWFKVCDGRREISQISCVNVGQIRHDNVYRSGQRSQ
jgi:hypothetical protein